ncbi:MAG: hypothetical protein IV105_21875 [Rhizobacter sp.]|nr:hypothetical protein [Rhizobacter sp.]
MIKQRALQILWPAFLMAGVLEMMLFAVVDPGDLQWFGGAPIGWPRQAIYTVTFLIFWGVMSISGALTALLARSDADLNSVDPF